jgi:GNAT superfamily N-acetyltransferase
MTAEDIPEIVELGRAMHAESPRYRRLNYDPNKVANQVRSMVTGTLTTQPQGGAFVAVKDGKIIGMIGGYVAETFFGHDKVASDYAFYITPSERRKGRTALGLLLAFEKWAVAQGVVDIVPGVSTMIETQRTRQFFEKLGYEHYGEAMIKRVR